MERIHGNKIRESAQHYTELMTISFCNVDKTLTINLLRTKFPSNSTIGRVRSDKHHQTIGIVNNPCA